MSLLQTNKKIMADVEGPKKEKSWATLERCQTNFAKFDADDSGDIDIPELAFCMEKLGHTKTRKEVKRLVEIVDSDNTGTLNYEEFARCMLIEEGLLDGGEMQKKLEALDNIDAAPFKAEAEAIKAKAGNLQFATLGRGGAFQRPTPEQLAAMKATRTKHEEKPGESQEKLKFEGSATGKQGALLASTDMSHDDVARFEGLFKKKCVPGSHTLNRYSFIEAYGACFPHRKDAETYAHRVFDVFDSDGNNSIDWEEFLVYINKAQAGDLPKRCHYLFKIFDSSGDGQISLEEFEEMLESLHGVIDPESAKAELGMEAAIAADKAQKEFHMLVRRYFKIMDTDGNNEVDEAEFVACIETVDEIRKYVGL